MLGSEALPFSKTGGLADVLGALPSALARLGWTVTLAVPRYHGTTAGEAAERFPLAVGGYVRDVTVFEAPLAAGATAILIDCPDLFDRAALYGDQGGDYSDNPRRFAFLVRAAFEFIARRDARPDIVHAHDWQTGLAPVYLKALYAEHPVLGAVPSVFTIHNLAYQGLFDSDWLPRLDLPWDLMSIDRLEYWGRISLLKGGVTDAEIITTVSPTYAREIQTPELGFGFDGILRSRGADLIGILNGIDADQWDPSGDLHVPRPYDASDLAGKLDAKAALLTHYQIPRGDTAMKRPVIGMISRMVDQKGLDLLAALESTLPTLDATFIVLGTGEARYQDMWTRLAAAHPDRIGVYVGFDEALAHLIEAGADMFLMPSRFEPCGLNQMYSLRYGTVPVVRAVGGLADTVVDAAVPRRGNGFVFSDYSATALLAALQRAISAFGDRRKWKALQAAGMKGDYSWDRSAREYVTIYERAIRNAGGPRPTAQMRTSGAVPGPSKRRRAGATTQSSGRANGN
jgi:starch synthase